MYFKKKQKLASFPFSHSPIQYCATVQTSLLFLRVLLETGPPFYVVSRGIRRSSRLQCNLTLARSTGFSLQLLGFLIGQRSDTFSIERFLRFIHHRLQMRMISPYQQSYCL